MASGLSSYLCCRVSVIFAHGRIGVGNDVCRHVGLGGGGQLVQLEAGGARTLDASIEHRVHHEPASRESGQAVNRSASSVLHCWCGYMTLEEMCVLLQCLLWVCPTAAGDSNV